MKLLTVLCFALTLTACDPRPPEPDPGPGNPVVREDRNGIGMRMQLVPSSVGSVRQAATVVAQQEQAPGTYLCVCPPPDATDPYQTRTCTCEVEGKPAPANVCGDGILNMDTERCDVPGADGRAWCPPGTHCNVNGEPAADGTAYPACFACVPDAPTGG